MRENQQLKCFWALIMCVLLAGSSSATQGDEVNNIAPNRYIVLVRPGCSAGAAAAATADGGASLLSSGEVYTAAAAADSLQSQFADSLVVTKRYKFIEGFAFTVKAEQQQQQKEGAPAAASVTPAAIQALQADPCIALHLDRTAKLRSPTSTRRHGNIVPNNIQRIGAASGVKVNGAATVGIAVMDEGVAGHPDLNLAASVDCVRSIFGGCRTLRRPQAGAEGHATLVAGVAAARNGPEGGTVGVAPGSALYSINVFGPTTATTTDILAGLDWVQQFNANVTTPNGRGKIRVINMSFGDYSNDYKSTDGISLVDNPRYPGCGAGYQDVDPWHTAICKMAVDKQNGAVVVVAMANEGQEINTSVPDRYPEVIAVASMADADGKPGGRAFFCEGGKYADGELHLTDGFSTFSNYISVGNTVAEAHSVAAPGSCINSTFLDNGYFVESGCSFAAPHVSGVVALCFGKWAGVAGKTRPRDGPCQAAFAAGGAPAVVKLLVQSEQYRQRGADGFVGDRDRAVTYNCGRQSCKKHYGYLINANAF